MANIIIRVADEVVNGTFYTLQNITNDMIIITNELNTITNFSIEIGDENGEFYSSYINGTDGIQWNNAQFHPITVQDTSDDRYIFSGRIRDVNFEKKITTIFVQGNMGKLMDKILIDEVQDENQNIIGGSNFILWSGKVKETAYTYIIEQENIDFSETTDGHFPEDGTGTWSDEDVGGTAITSVQASAFGRNKVLLMDGGVSTGNNAVARYTFPTDDNEGCKYIEFKYLWDNNPSYSITLYNENDDTICTLFGITNNLYLGYGSGSSVVVYNATVTETWFTVKVVSESDNKIGVYLDGVLKSTGITPINAYTRIKSIKFTATGAASTTDLYIDDIIWSSDSKAGLLLCQDNEAETEFDWDDNELITSEKGVGILLTDSTDELSVTWSAIDHNVSGGFSSYSTFDADLLNEDDDQTNIANGVFSDGDKSLKYAVEVGETFNDSSVEFNISGTTVENTNTLKKITLFSKQGFYTIQDENSGFTRIEIWNYTTGSWVTSINGINLREYSSARSATKKPNWISIALEITDNFDDYIHDSGTHYNNIKVRYITKAGVDPDEWPKNLWVDYLKVKIEYKTTSYSIIGDKIISNHGSSVILDNTNILTSGVVAGDKFVIGQNSTNVLEQVCGYAGVNVDIDAGLSKFCGRNFKGMVPLDVVKSISSLEDAYYFEETDSIEGTSTIFIRLRDVETPSAFTGIYNSAYTIAGSAITSANYDNEFKLQRKSNQYKSVRIMGNPNWGINVQLTDSSITNNSPLEKLIIDNSITVEAEALDIATGILNRIKIQRPSYIVKITDSNALKLQAGRTVVATFSNPTIAEATYPIRKTKYIISYPLGPVMNEIQLGLGETEPEDKMAKFMNQSRDIAWKGILDSQNPIAIIGSPAFSHTDLTNVSSDQHHTRYSDAEAIAANNPYLYTDSDTEAVIDAELVDGESIDNAIDALILTHKGDATAHQDAPALIATHAGDDDAHHDPVSIQAGILALSGQELRLVNDAAATVSDIDTATDLGGVTANDSTLATQKAIKTYVDNSVYTDSDAEAVIDAELADGESIDAAIDALILTHKGDVDAHHAKYTDGEAQSACIETGSITEDLSTKSPSSELVFDGLAAKLENLSEDLSPELGAQLDCLAHGITSNDVDNLTYKFSRAKIWSDSGVPDVALFGHRDASSPVRYYGLKFTADLDTQLNSGFQRSTILSVYNEAILTAAHDGLTLNTGPFDMNNLVLKNPLDPTDGSHVGDMNFNDSRYESLSRFIDEDSMASDSAVKYCSQQSIKAYVDAQVAGGGWSAAQSVAAVEAAGLVLASTKVYDSADEDTKHYLGRAGIGYAGSYSDWAAFGHRDLLGDDSYPAVIQRNDGAITNIQATESSGVINLRINDNTIVTVDKDEISCNSKILSGVADPTADDEVGDRGYNDGRYETLHTASLFKATRNSAQSLSSSNHTIIIYDDEEYDLNSEYNPTTGRFTAKVEGYYHFDAGLLTANVAWTAGQLWQLRFAVNGTGVLIGTRHTVEYSRTEYGQASVSGDLYLDVDDYVEVEFYHNRSTMNCWTDATFNIFSGHLIREV